jgi:glycosyltransferase 2 family protein
MSAGLVLAPARATAEPARPRSAVGRTLWGCARLLGGAAILGVLVWRLGSGPFLDAVKSIDWRPLAAAGGIAVVTTVASAQRWSVVASGLGVGVPLRTAVAAYYRSQFLNSTLPGGVLGDVHRAVRHGRDVGDVGLSLRAVAVERSAGQIVQLFLTALVLLLLPSPMRSLMPAVLTGVAAATLIAALLSRPAAHGAPSLWRRIARALAADLRNGLLARRSWPSIVLCSVVAVAGYVSTFLIAARTAGCTASLLQVLPLAMVVLLATGIPINLAGWGPREGVAAWAFSLSGLSAGQGVATAVVYGVLAFVSTLPGAVVLVSLWLRQQSPVRRLADRRRCSYSTSAHSRRAENG